MKTKSKFERYGISKRFPSMLAVDTRRMFTMPLLYIMIGISFVVPILVLVMTTMMDGSMVVDRQTGAQKVMEGFTNVWQAIGTTGGAADMMNMDMTSMLNINLIFFAVVVFVCLFVGDDFRSGYVKSLFTSRAGKGDYVASKTVVGCIAASLMLIAYFIGAMFGGKIAGLPFTLEGATAFNVLLCMLAKICFAAIFVAMALLGGVIGKQRTWLSMLAAVFMGMLLFTMAPIITPLNSGIMNLILCFAGGVLFSIGIGAVSRTVLTRTDLV